ncbi:MAG: response regulator transcription factor [Terriglobia bacterium]|nr:response regulator transcription factor [Terriglobia bacterium]
MGMWEVKSLGPTEFEKTSMLQVATRDELSLESLVSLLSSETESYFEIVFRFQKEDRRAEIVLTSAAEANQSLKRHFIGDLEHKQLHVVPPSVTTRLHITDTWARFDEVEIDFQRMTVLRSGQSIVLTAHEFKTLKYFVSHPEVVISRAQLLDEVWGYQNYPTTRTVDNRIMKLRKKLEADPTKPAHFLTVHGIGYKFVP